MITSVKFVKSVNIYPSSDFNKTVVNSYTKTLNEMYFKEKFSFDVVDFLDLFTFENLTTKALIDFTYNELGIKFTSINLDFTKHSTRRDLELYSENKNKFNFGNFWFLFSSEYDYKFISDDGITLKLLKEDKELSFDMQTLKNMNTTYQSLSL